MENCEKCGVDMVDHEVVWVRAKPAGTRIDWNQPVCMKCYEVDNPGREPVLIPEEEE